VADTGRPPLDETLPSRGGEAAAAGMPDLGSRYRLDLELGRGGMGRVFAGRDLKLDREVAIKILIPGSHHDEELLRFEQEARAAGSLNHPNVLAVYDIGSWQGGPYIVSERLKGTTLRQRLPGKPLSLKRALDYAVQLAQGLAAAHERGVVHRDLKPENLFITEEGRLKILDFGIAKLVRPQAARTPRATETGTILGTVGYMSPEQVRGEPADHRSDLFSAGVVLHEMLSGTQPFERGSAAETSAAILSEEPPDLPVPPQLDRIVRRCLEKDPGHRYQSAKDLAFDLESVLAQPLLPGRRRRWSAAAIALALVLGALAGFFAGRIDSASALRFTQLTFRRGVVWSARFAPGGRNVVYSAAWDGGPYQLFTVDPGRPEARRLDVPRVQVASISPAGELAIVSESNQPMSYFSRTGTLSRAPLGGGAPRPLLNDVRDADWVPGGDDLAVIHQVDDQSRIELPAGHVLYQTGDWLSHLRVSPDGARIAFLEHPIVGDDNGSVAVIDRNGSKRTLTRRFASTRGLAWSPRDDEIWFTAAESGSARSLRAVSLAGRERLLLNVPGALLLHDVSSDGRVLLSRMNERISMYVRAPGEGRDQDLSLFDWTIGANLSDDGKKLLFSEAAQGGGEGGAVYLRVLDGSQPIRLGDGIGMSLSGDGTQAILHSPKSPQLIRIVPTGPGESRTIQLGMTVVGANWFPDGKRILVAAVEGSSGKLRAFVMDAGTGRWKPLSEPGIRSTGLIRSQPVSPDGKWAIIRRAAGFALYPIEGGEPRPVPALDDEDLPIGWSSDGRFIRVKRPGVPAPLELVDLATGERKPWIKVGPPDAAGLLVIIRVNATPAGDAYAYYGLNTLSELFVVEGVR
jgi:Tol biopolymer transport system component